MATSFLMSLKNVPFGKTASKLWSPSLAQSSRLLFAKATLGLDVFGQQKQQIQNQMANISSKFREKMNTFSEDVGSNMIFTEDLKNMIHLAENDEDINLVVKMMKKFNQQNKQLRFGTFVFGPIVMRLFHMYNKPDIALECFRSPELTGFFDQLITYQILLDLLYENGRYDEILTLFKEIQDRQIEGTKFPRNSVVLVAAACYKLNSPESFQYILNLWNQMSNSGHFALRRTITFCAGLAINQHKPDVALEMLSVAKNPGYTTIRNLKALALLDVGRIDDVIQVLKSIITEDQASNVQHTFNKDVLDRIKEKVVKLNDADISRDFDRLMQLFEKQGHILNMSLDEQLCMEIQQPSTINNRQTNRFSRYNSQNSNFNNYRRNEQRRPGLKDIV